MKKGIILKEEIGWKPVNDNNILGDKINVQQNKKKKKSNKK